jgi:hypothetical protein
MNSSLVKTSLLILKIASVVFIAAALYHLIAIFRTLNNSTGWRNILFVLINLWCAFEITRTKKYFIVLFTVLFVQQAISHGSSVINNLHEHRIDWLSVFVLTAITVIYFALIISASVKFKMTSKD